MSSVNRRTFIAQSIQIVAAVALAGCGGAPAVSSPSAATTKPTTPGQTPVPAAGAQAVTPGIATAVATRPAAAVAPIVGATPAGESAAQLAVVRGSSPEAITRAAVKALGGIGRFVSAGQRVLIKPNICTSQAPEYAATTNPEVVATLVSLCREAGAAKVLVVDNPFSGFNTAYQRSGIQDAVKRAGGDIETMTRLKYRKVEIPRGKDIKSWTVYDDALTFDVLINVPIAKNHNLATLTLGMKNLMGLIDNPGAFHSNIGQRLADLATIVRPSLIVLDAVRILTRNGPTGGDLRDVKPMNLVVATTDPVAADAYGATLFGMNGESLPYVRAGAELGLGEKDLSKLRLAELSL